jgi:hypothetical protein
LGESESHQNVQQPLKIKARLGHAGDPESMASLGYTGRGYPSCHLNPASPSYSSPSAPGFFLNTFARLKV